MLAYAQDVLESEIGAEYTVVPWGAEPSRLWNASEIMQHYRAGSWLQLLINYENARAFLAEARARGVLDQDREPLTFFLGEVQKVRDLLVDITFPASLRRQADGIVSLSEEAISSQIIRDEDIVMILDRGFQLEENIVVETNAFLFFAVPPNRLSWYQDPQRAFGQSTVDTFSADISLDVRDACQCYALGQWTACVFHSMRILEHGLRVLAEEVGLTMEAIELENWKTIIDRIEKAIREMEAEPKTPKKSERVQFYAEAAIQFRYFKDAWRNHVSHSRVSYDEQKAIVVLTHVRDFMQHLAYG